MKGRKTIRRQMFETYVAALLVVVVTFIMVYMSQTYQMMQKQITDSMTQLSENVTERLDDEVKQISLLTERIIFSQDVRKIFLRNYRKAKVRRKLTV